MEPLTQRPGKRRKNPDRKGDFHRIERVLCREPEFRVPFDEQSSAEEERVRIFASRCEKNEIREIG